MVFTRSGGKLRALVTGGSGFLGQHLVAQLLATGKYDVRVFDVRDNGTSAVPVTVGDLRKPEQVVEATKHMDVVFHCATAAPTGANALNNNLMYSVNVDGTRNIIDACVTNSVPKLVYTSSASVVFDGSNLYNVDEQHPYAKKPMDYYTNTKILGEKLVLEANGKGGLMTCALRPSGIFGEHDPVFVPTLISQAKKGKTKFIIGRGDNMMDFTYVGNVAQAHVQAAAAMTPQAVAGKAYFITNQEPKLFWGMMGDVCGGLGYTRPHLKLPFLLIIIIAFLFEYVIRTLLKPIKTINSDFTVNRILIATTNRTFKSERAAQDFGYRPQVNMQDALSRTLSSFQHLRNPQLQKKAT
mmetsp:Transcript_11696/g.31887  ORF Transcript_11696/g.31887 Transcript_11696/m.31887 type:complete len:354 (-) Transcript_11696:490-1551(-)